MGVSLVVMLSGSSTRFGSNKLFAKYKGKMLYETALLQAINSGAEPIIVVTAYQEILDDCRRHHPDIVPVNNSRPELGISESVKLGLEAAIREAQGELSGCGFLVGDQPFLRAHTVRDLFQTFSENPDKICMLSDGEKTGNPVIFPRSFFRELLHLEGDHGGKSIAVRYPEDILKIPAAKEELTDIDIREQLP